MTPRSRSPACSVARIFPSATVPLPSHGTCPDHHRQSLARGGESQAQVSVVLVKSPAAPSLCPRLQSWGAACLGLTGALPRWPVLQDTPQQGPVPPVSGIPRTPPHPMLQ